jgi:hypothetical protein
MTYTKDDKQKQRMRHIQPSDFLTCDEDKTKLNWFLFEFALELESFITKDRSLRSKLSIKGISDHQIGRFCIHYAKHMKSHILDRVSNQTSNIRIGYEPIEAFFPKLSDRLVDRLLTVIGKAWESQTDLCVACPTRCISEKDEKALMFDDQTYYE